MPSFAYSGRMENQEQMGKIPRSRKERYAKDKPNEEPTPTRAVMRPKRASAPGRETRDMTPRHEAH